MTIADDIKGNAKSIIPWVVALNGCRFDRGADDVCRRRFSRQLYFSTAPRDIQGLMK